jgi:hypothetical protein
VRITDNVTSKLVQLEGIPRIVFRRAMDWAEESFLAEIDAVKWTWLGQTIRVNGETVESPRDIVDMGGLRDSQTRENMGELRTVFTWTGGEGETYALEVHNGYVHKSGKRVAARPFTKDTISRLDKVIDNLFLQEVKNGSLSS